VFRAELLTGFTERMLGNNSLGMIVLRKKFDVLSYDEVLPANSFLTINMREQCKSDLDMIPLKPD
jgi:hypothetical protein